VDITDIHHEVQTEKSAFLRIRRPGFTEVETCRAPFAQCGYLTSVCDDDSVEGGILTMQTATGTIQIFIEDLAHLFGGCEDAQRLFRDAVNNQDCVEILVLRDRLAYRNEAQYKRVVEAFPTITI
jgi:hypothetical protein